MTKIPDVAWTRVSGFVRQHTHDLRNELNGLDLEAALLADIVEDPEARECVARMRAEIRKVAAHLRTLTAKFAEVRASRLVLPASELFLIWQDQLKELPSLEVDWSSQLAGEEVNVDPSGVADALRELLMNAHSFRGAGKDHPRLQGTARAEGGTVVFELLEPKSDIIDPMRWGRDPLASQRRGGYGLGLCSLLQTVEASGGTVTWRFDADAKALVSTLSFPQASEG